MLRWGGDTVLREKEKPQRTWPVLAATHLDSLPNQLTPMWDSLCLVDAGFAINLPFPLALRPQRAVDLILSFDYSLNSPFQARHYGGAWKAEAAGSLG